MNNLSGATWVELLKARRSRMPMATSLAFLMVPLVGGLFMLILKDPELARRMGLITMKAQLAAGSADWPSYLNLLCQAVAVAGIMGFSLIGAWVFGREFSDRTVRDLLALPTGRTTIVLGKFVIVALWSAALALLILVVGLVVASLVDLPPVASQVITSGVRTLLIVMILTITSVTPIGYVASAGHGYLPAVGAMLLALASSQIAAVLGWGEFFPWAIPALVAQGQPVGPVSYLIILLTGVAGVAATFAWWRYADQTY